MELDEWVQVYSISLCTSILTQLDPLHVIHMIFRQSAKVKLVDAYDWDDFWLGFDPVTLGICFLSKDIGKG